MDQELNLVELHAWLFPTLKGFSYLYFYYILIRSDIRGLSIF